MAILAFDTSTKVCTAAIYDLNFQLIHDMTFRNEDYVHSEKLVSVIQEMVVNHQLTFQDFKYFFIGLGPGSYTGLRIGASLVKGLGFASSTPIIGAESLDLIYAQAQDLVDSFDLIIPMIDARRNEVYLKIFNPKGEVLKAVEAVEIEAAYFDQFEGKRVLLIGDGADKFESIVPKNISIRGDIEVSCANLSAILEKKITNQEFLDTAYFEPTYVKSVRVGKPKKIFG